jgi:hypothetical protein
MHGTMVHMSGAPVWLPSLLFLGGLVIVVLPISIARMTNYRFIAYPDIVGLIRFRPSVASWFLAVSLCLMLGEAAVQMPLPIAVPVTSTVALAAVWAVLRPLRAVRSCYVHPSGDVTLMRGSVAIPFDLNHYRYVRMYVSRVNKVSQPSMLVMCRDPHSGARPRLVNFVFPCVTTERVVVFFNRWRAADGSFIGPRELGVLFFQACVRAGRPPITERSPWGAPEWEVSPDALA